MLTLLTQLKTEIREIKDQVRANTALLQRLSDSQVEEEEELDLPQEIQLPVSTVDELKTLDDAIKADKVLQKHLVSMLMFPTGLLHFGIEIIMLTG